VSSHRVLGSGRSVRFWVALRGGPRGPARRARSYRQSPAAADRGRTVIVGLRRLRRGGAAARVLAGNHAKASAAVGRIKLTAAEQDRTRAVGGALWRLSHARCGQRQRQGGGPTRSAQKKKRPPAIAGVRTSQRRPQSLLDERSEERTAGEARAPASCRVSKRRSGCVLRRKVAAGSRAVRRRVPGGRATRSAETLRV